MSSDLLAGVRFLVIDLETTGLPGPGDAILEVGLVEIQRLAVAGRWSTLVHPGRLLPGHGKGTSVQVRPDRRGPVVGDRPGPALVNSAVHEYAPGRSLPASN